MRENPRETRLCDLHVHSVFSDGTLTPEALIEIVAQSFAACEANRSR